MSLSCLFTILKYILFYLIEEEKIDGDDEDDGEEGGTDDAPDGSCPAGSHRLVSGTDGVLDGKLTASSSYSHCPVTKGRLNSDRAWCAAHKTTRDWIQVYL